MKRQAEAGGERRGAGGKLIEHAAVPIVPSPSGLPTQHLVSARDGSEHIFVAQQWLEPGDRVLLHTHPVDEVLTFLSGGGEATLGDDIVSIGAGISLYIPAGLVHGFRCTVERLHVLVVFPGGEFAETTIVDTAQRGGHVGLQPRPSPATIEHLRPRVPTHDDNRD